MSRRSAKSGLLRMLTAVATSVLLTGCGLKGDLYLPDPETEPADNTAEQSATIAPETEDDTRSAPGTDGSNDPDKEKNSEAAPKNSTPQP